MRLLLLLAIFLSPCAFAQEATEMPHLHFINDSVTMVELDEENREGEIYIAVPKENQNQEFKIIIQENQDSYLLEISNRSKLNAKFYSYEKVHYGGRIEIGERLNFNGSVICDRKNSVIVINHNQEFSLFKINVRSLDIQPIIHNYVRFTQLHYKSEIRVQELFIQPANLGLSFDLNGKKGKKSNLILSAGPVGRYDLNQKIPKVSPISFNFKLTIPL